MSRDYRLRVSSPYFLHLYGQKYKSVATVGPPVAVGPCALHTLHTLLLRHWIWPLHGTDFGGSKRLNAYRLT